MTTESERLLSQALQLHQSGQFEQAERLYRQALAADPDHADGLNLLGVLCLQCGRAAEAVTLIGKAIALNDRIADFHNNIAEAYRVLGRIEPAIDHFRKAGELDPGFAEAQENLAKMLRLQGRLDEATEALKRALAIAPGNIDTSWHLADTLRMRGEYATALPRIHDILAQKPGFVPALITLSLIHLAQDRPDEALAAARRALDIANAPDIGRVFSSALRNARNIQDDPKLRALAVRALSEPWGRPNGLAAICARLVKNNPAVKAAIAARTVGHDDLAKIAVDDLFRSLLETALICDIELERLLTKIRSLLADIATGTPAASDESVLSFYCALARQCFINDYVFDYPESDRRRIDALRESVVSAMQAGAAPPVLALVALATYEPLHRLPQAERLLPMSWPAPVAALLAQQIAEPLEESRHRAAMPRLTDVDDEISRRVQQQYEENPYPSWVKADPVGATTFRAEITRQFPDMELNVPSGNLDILIAGCGTGQQSIETARLYPDARVLAIDLSLASLGYAQRKTRELGLRNIEYAQADILKLGVIGRTFDVIESSGVLHHLADPMQGWRVLLSLLRPRGFMRLGFYSKSARVHVAAARAFIAGKGYRPTPGDIRRCRRDLMALDPAVPMRAVVDSPDFFSISSCRDLLFHAQEHTLTLPEIAAFIAANDLTFLGLNDLAAPVLEGYRGQFPQDAAMTDLANWHTFETQHPRMFGGMYQFWVQRRT